MHVIYTLTQRHLPTLQIFLKLFQLSACTSHTYRSPRPLSRHTLLHSLLLLLSGQLMQFRALRQLHCACVCTSRRLCACPCGGAADAGLTLRQRVRVRVGLFVLERIVEDVFICWGNELTLCRYPAQSPFPFEVSVSTFSVSTPHPAPPSGHASSHQSSRGSTLPAPPSQPPLCQIPPSQPQPSLPPAPPS